MSSLNTSPNTSSNTSNVSCEDSITSSNSVISSIEGSYYLVVNVVAANLTVRSVSLSSILLERCNYSSDESRSMFISTETDSDDQNIDLTILDNHRKLFIHILDKIDNLEKQLDEQKDQHVNLQTLQIENEIENENK